MILNEICSKCGIGTHLSETLLSFCLSLASSTYWL